MPRKTLFGFIIVNIAMFSIFSLVIPTKAEEAIIDCTETLANAIETMQEGRNVLIDTRIFKLSNRLPNQPANRLYKYTFIMHGSGAGNIMWSPKYRKIIATRIIKTCQSNDHHP